MTQYEVIVVGGGIGGLTVAALLTARGMKVCLLERSDEVGGCATPFQKSGFSFEQGASVYCSWGTGEIYDRLFSELGARAPEFRKTFPAYLVRLPDGAEVPITESDEEYETALRLAFPECGDTAVVFLRELTSAGRWLITAHHLSLDSPAAPSQFQRNWRPSENKNAAQFIRDSDTVGSHLFGTSNRFHRFMDAQLQMFANTGADDCSYAYAAIALALIRGGAYDIKGGASSLVTVLSDSFQKNGGTLRLNSTVLRVSHGVGGEAAGVELLNGERIGSSRAVISNLTVWDTYGKLIGLTRVPARTRSEIKGLKGWGAYLIYLSMEEKSARSLKSLRILTLTDWQENQSFDPEECEFMFSAAPLWDQRAPPGKRAATVCTFADVEPWFSFHEDESEFEEIDQRKLETWWNRLHKAMPELGESVEVIETATPRTFYETTRRRFGMVGGVGRSTASSSFGFPSHQKDIPNLYMVGDSTSLAPGIAGASLSALLVADEITRSHSR